MKRMRILVIGASGFIGRYLVRRLASDATYDVTATYRSRHPEPGVGSWHRLELTDDSAIEPLFRAAAPDVVVHLAAMADVATAERQPEAATAVNVDATAAVARLCQQHNARLVFVSTEYVFDGVHGFYRESDQPAPTTHSTAAPSGRPSRLSPTSPPAPRSSAPASSTAGPLPAAATSSPCSSTASAPASHTAPPPRSSAPPVYVEHLVDGIAALAENHHSGVHHIAGSDWVSMHDFALSVAQHFSLDVSLILPAEDVSPHPDRLGLDSTATMQRLQLPHPGLTQGLAAMRATEPRP